MTWLHSVKQERKKEWSVLLITGEKSPTVHNRSNIIMADHFPLEKIQIFSFKLVISVWLDLGAQRGGGWIP